MCNDKMVDFGQYSVAEYPVTKIVWDAVRLWAKDNGYTDLAVGRGKGRQPVGCITWYDAVKFCNALSELAGLEPCYYANGQIYRNGRCDITEKDVKDTRGYRLPLKAEWIEAAGGKSTKFFWGEKEQPGRDMYVWHDKNAGEIPQAVGQKKPNPYGLHDIIGNVYEWCFDKKESTLRVMMGGSVALDAILATEFETFAPADYKCYETGLRVFCGRNEVEGVETVAKKSSFYGTEQWPEPIYTDMSEKAIAARLKNELGEDTFSLEIKGLIDEEKYQTAFVAFRNAKLDRIKETVKKKPENTDAMRRSEEELFRISDVFDIAFWKGNFEYDVSHIFPELLVLMQRYREKGDKRYLDCYMLILRAYLIRHKAEFDALEDELLRLRNNTPETWAWGNGFNPGKRSGIIMDSLRNFVYDTEPEDYDLFPADLFCELAIVFSTYGMYPFIKDGRDRVANQISHISNWITEVTYIFPEFKNASLYEKIALQRWKKGTTRVLYPDGSACEQSLHYNYAIPDVAMSIGSRVMNPQLVEELKTMVSNIDRMLISIRNPLGFVPDTAYTFDWYPVPKDKGHIPQLCALSYQLFPNHLGWKENERMKNVLLNPQGKTPEYQSLCFPYGGTAVIRDGYSYDSQYMYFFAPRKGSGHTAEAVNDIQLWAFGRRLLRTGAAYSYGIVQRLPKEQLCMMEDGDRYCKSSYSRNTVLVDGKGQSRLVDGENNKIDKYPDTIGYRWYESDGLVYTEGRYEDGYYDCVDKVVHKREVVFLKKSGIWIIIDRLYSNDKHTYAQTWHFDIEGEHFEAKVGGKEYSWDADGFLREEIITGENRLFTCQEGEANIFMYHLGNVEYERHFAQKEPFAGWGSCYYENATKFRYYPVEEIYCKFNGEGNTVLVTILEPGRTEESRMKNFSSGNTKTEFEMDGEKYCISQDDSGRVEIHIGEHRVVVADDRKDEYYEVVSGVRKPFGRVKDMKWKDMDEGSEPVYEYEF